MNINKYPIWLYWENKNKDAEELDLVRKCKELFTRYDNVIILNEVLIHQYLSGIVDCSRISYIAQKADYYRAKLLYEYGGIWIDMDTILLEDITYLYQELLSSDFEMRGNYDLDLIKNEMVFNPQLLVFKPKSIIAEKWYKYDEEYILGGSDIPWAALGGIALGKIVSENNYKDRVMTIPHNIRFDLGYENKSYMKYYSVETDFINEKINFIVDNGVKYITLYGTFMYNLNIPENCLLHEMFMLKNKNNFKNK